MNHNMKAKLKEALDNHKGWAGPTFGGMWQGLIYGLIAASGIGVALYSTPIHILPWIFLGVFFYIITQYDSTLVALWNEREHGEVYAKFLMDNLSEIRDDIQVIDISTDLDGTNEDK